MSPQVKNMQFPLCRSPEVVTWLTFYTDRMPKAHVHIVWALHLASSIAGSSFVVSKIFCFLVKKKKKNQSMVQPKTGNLFGHIFKHMFSYISEKYPNLELWLYLSYFIFNHRISLWKLQPKGNTGPRRKNLAFYFLKYIFSVTHYAR